jgi:hypothetical protein
LTVRVVEKSVVVQEAEHASAGSALDSGAKRNALKKSGFERPFQARQSGILGVEAMTAAVAG